MKKYPAGTDAAVLIIFFNRPESLRLVFEQVRKSRPSRLFLYQDGPRGPEDMVGIEACREVVSDIDWECDVRKWYRKENHGCDPSQYESQKWAFTMTDKCIFLEDDDVPSLSFIPFCKEMLDRYEDDRRIFMITGINYDERTENIPYDYFFSTTFTISGWATWKSRFEKCDEAYSFLDDEYAVKMLGDMINRRKYQKEFLEMCRDHRASGKAYYESLLHAAMFLSSSLCVVPRVNMINNLGALGEGVHLSGSNRTMPRAYRRIFEMDRHELSFPLRHPEYMIEDVEYKERMFRAQAWGYPYIKVARSFEELFLCLRYGEFRKIGWSIKNRLGKWFGWHKYC